MNKTSSQSAHSDAAPNPSTSASRMSHRQLMKNTGNNIWSMMQTIIAASVVLATLFTLWTPANLFSNELLKNMWISMQSEEDSEGEGALHPTPTVPDLLSIGIVAGHWQNDSGAVCPDGLTEVDLNLRIATLVRQNLINEGYAVDLLSEFDETLYQYQALALISIHNDSCDYINDEATGFKVSTAMSTRHPEKANRLTACLTHYYGEYTQLPFHQNTITNDMTSYHAFDEINDKTPAVIIEAGFMNLDRQLLTEHTDIVAQGISAGILCYIRNEPIPDNTDLITP